MEVAQPNVLGLEIFRTLARAGQWDERGPFARYFPLTGRRDDHHPRLERDLSIGIVEELDLAGTELPATSGLPAGAPGTVAHGADGTRAPSATDVSGRSSQVRLSWLACQT